MPKIAILLGTHNGSRYLSSQLKSYTNQTIQDWQLWASDDDSKDTTLDILQNYQQELGESKVKILRGQNLGLGHNFLSLALNREIQAEYYAFSDQDDIWNPDKLERAISHLEATPQHTPAMYFSRHLVISHNDKIIRTSNHPKRPPGFRNALIQNIASGNSIVLNQAARALLIEAGITNAQYHDWWCYLLISGAGGKLIYDPEPTLKYRQHTSNNVGTNTSLKGKIKRARLLLEGKFNENIIKNLECINQAKKLLTTENKEALRLFEIACTSPFFSSLSHFFMSGSYRQNRFETLVIALTLATASSRLPK